MFDRRRSVRRRVLLDGTIRVAKLPLWGLSCSVRDLGADGARVAFDGRALVPDLVELGVSGTPPRRARLVWIRDGQAGLALVEANPGAGSPSDTLVSPRNAVAAARDTDRLRARIAAVTARADHYRAPRGFTRP